MSLRYGLIDATGKLGGLVHGTVDGTVEGTLDGTLCASSMSSWPVSMAHCVAQSDGRIQARGSEPGLFAHAFVNACAEENMVRRLRGWLDGDRFTRRR